MILGTKVRAHQRVLPQFCSAFVAGRKRQAALDTDIISQEKSDGKV
jgi:hypothetical protein